MKTNKNLFFCTMIPLCFQEISLFAGIAQLIMKDRINKIEEGLQNLYMTIFEEEQKSQCAMNEIFAKKCEQMKISFEQDFSIPDKIEFLDNEKYNLRHLAIGKHSQIQACIEQSYDDYEGLLYVEKITPTIARMFEAVSNNKNKEVEKYEQNLLLDFVKNFQEGGMEALQTREQLGLAITHDFVVSIIRFFNTGAGGLLCWFGYGSYKEYVAYCEANEVVDKVATTLQSFLRGYLVRRSGNIMQQAVQPIQYQSIHYLDRCIVDIQSIYPKIIKQVNCIDEVFQVQAKVPKQENVVDNFLQM